MSASLLTAIQQMRLMGGTVVLACEIPDGANFHTAAIVSGASVVRRVQSDGMVRETFLRTIDGVPCEFSHTRARNLREFTEVLEGSDV